ncbi:MAG: hypothetical protein KQH63_09570 [Desulfobulbaceae bacterium]|nr:hypothetical protein [Desulfobulbaceae bacterium]
MKPTVSPIDDPQMDLFKTELSAIIDLNHPFAKLAAVVDWAELEKVFGESYCEDNGRAAIATRLMVALQYLKFTYDLSDESVVRGWVENPY